jgi:zinc transport system permease protein
MLIIPAATARRLATGPEQMALLSAIIGVIAVVGGLEASLNWDTPSGPSIVVAALALFVVAMTPVADMLVRALRGHSRRPAPNDERSGQ